MGQLNFWNPLSNVENVLANWDDFWGRPVNYNNKRDYWSPRADISEDKANYYVEMDLPAVKREDIRVDVKDGTLSIHGERRNTSEKATKADKQVHVTERFYGSFLRRFSLPESINSEGLSARFDNGVLTIILPKREAQNNPIEVQVQ